MRRLLLSAALASVSAALLSADAPMLTGQWKIHNSVAGTESDTTCTLEQKDKAITGTCKAATGDAPVTGTIEETKVSWQHKSSHEGTEITIIYTGRLAAGGTMKGAVEVLPYGVSGDFTATQEKK